MPNKNRAAKSVRPPLGSTADVLRRSLAQAEVHLHEIEEEAARVSSLQRRELDMHQHEFKKLLEQLEEIRMQECMAPREFEALRLSSQDSDKTSAGSKLIASSSPKYQMERDRILRKRTECAQAEARLASTLQHLGEVKRSIEALKRQGTSSGLAAHARKVAVHTMQGKAREQLRSLELLLAKELEGFSEMVVNAKAMRAQLDVLLTTQNRHCQNKAKLELQLFEMMKEMSFIMEVCNLIFEEREQHMEELRELERMAAEENNKYELALEELTAVLEQNDLTRKQNDDKLEQLRISIQDTRKERLSLVRELESVTEPTLPLARASSGRLNDVDGELVGEVAGADGSKGMMESRTLAQKIEVYDEYYHRLAEYVESHDIADVSQFLDTSSEEHYRCFTEVNFLQDEITNLEAERRQLSSVLAELTHGSEEKQRTMKEMADLQDKLKAEEHATENDEKDSQQTTQLLNALVRQVHQLVHSVGGTREMLQEHTGAADVLAHTASACLAFVEQRVEEYLVAFSRNSSHSIQETGDGSLMGTNAANTVVRRPALHAKNEVTAEALVQHRGLPRSAEMGAVGQGHSVMREEASEAHVLSRKEMLQLVQDRLNGRTPV